MKILTNPFEICEALGIGMKGSGPVGFSLAVDDAGKPLHLVIGGGNGWRFSEAKTTTTAGGPGSGGAVPGPERFKTREELGGAWTI